MIAALAGSAAAASFGGKAFAFSPKMLKIELVAPKTGQLANFYKEVPFLLEQINKHLGRHIKIDGRKAPYEIVIRDSQFDPSRALQVAQEMIFSEQVDLITTLASPATVNSVSDQCEANGIACVGTDCPLEPYYFGRSTPKQGFRSFPEYGTHTPSDRPMAQGNEISARAPGRGQYGSARHPDPIEAGADRLLGPT